MFDPITLQRSLIGLALFTAVGVLVHDTKLDQAATIALSIPIGLSVGAAASTVKLKGDAHTHVERAAFDKSAKTANGMPPRGDNRKYLLTKHARGFNMPEPHTLVYEPVLA